MEEIFIRRSVRKFLKDNVEMDIVKQMIDAAMHAPSAKNQQPWHFIVISDQDVIEDLMKTSPGSKALKEANKVVAFVLEKNAPNFIFIQEDMSAAVENFMLMGVNLKVGTVWVGVYPNMERCSIADKVLMIDENYHTFALIGLGYPSEKDAFHNTQRYDESRVHYNKW